MAEDVDEEFAGSVEPSGYLGHQLLVVLHVLEHLWNQEPDLKSCGVSPGGGWIYLGAAGRPINSPTGVSLFNASTNYIIFRK